MEIEKGKMGARRASRSPFFPFSVFHFPFSFWYHSPATRGFLPAPTEESRMKRRRARACGFSLIELLIVIVVILVIAALAIPSFLRSKIRANEAAAVAALRAITTAQVSYQTTYQQGFAPSLDVLKPPPPGTPPGPGAADLIDSVLAGGVRHGYNFLYAPIDSDGNGQPDSYTVNANPVLVGRTGDKYFYVDQTNVIRENIGGPADASSPPVPKQ
jgi:prepilin-type N-terminal cleavage/methylation domain-containing protein